MLDWETRAIAAEKTVHILKDQVQRLYNGDQLAIQRQLTRATERAQHAHHRQVVADLRNQELEQYNSRLAHEVARKTTQIQRILDNVTTGFLVLNRVGEVCGDFTASCKTLIHPEIHSGARFANLLGLDTMRSFELEFALDQLFDDILPEELCLDQIPGRIEHVDGHILQIEGRVLRDAQHEVEGLLLTINDISSLEEAQKESARNKLLLKLLRDREAFLVLLQDIKQQLAIAHRAIDANNQATVRHVVHTIKGNTASFGLSWLALQIHDMEANATLSHAHLDTIAEELRTFLSIHQSILQLDYDGTEVAEFAVSSKSLESLMSLSDQLEHSHARELGAWVEQILRRPARNLLGPIESLVNSISAKLEKEVMFEFVGAELPIDHRTLRPLFRNLVHLFKNALDHGLELPAERLEKGKPMQGLLRLEIAQERQDLAIIIQDDGRGLDAQRLRDVALEKGLITEGMHEALSDEQSYHLIFKDDFSTRDEVTDVSGRGVGLAAVQSIVKSLGGEIFISSSQGQGTTFRIIVPHSIMGLGMAEGSEEISTVPSHDCQRHQARSSMQ